MLKNYNNIRLYIVVLAYSIALFFGMVLWPSKSEKNITETVSKYNNRYIEQKYNTTIGEKEKQYQTVLIRRVDKDKFVRCFWHELAQGGNPENNKVLVCE